MLYNCFVFTGMVIVSEGDGCEQPGDKALSTIIKVGLLASITQLFKGTPWDQTFAVLSILQN